MMNVNPDDALIAMDFSLLKKQKNINEKKKKNELCENSKISLTN